MNPDTGEVRSLQLSSFLDSAGDTLSRALRNNDPSWKLKTDLVKSNDQLVLFTPNGDKIEVIDLKSMSGYLMTLPFSIDSVVLSSPGKWLVQDTSSGKYVIEKSSPSSPCPNVLKDVDQGKLDLHKTGWLLGGSSDKIGDDVLSAALEQKIESPNRLFSTDNTYATISVGFPELDSSNEIYYLPRNGRVRGFSAPIVTENGQIIKTVSPDQVPADVLPGGKKHPGITGYLEIVDVGHRKLRYIPIPE